MLEIPGQSALSTFRLAKLEKAIRPACPGLRSISSAFVYFVELDAPLASEEQKRLKALLRRREPALEAAVGIARP